MNFRLFSKLETQFYPNYKKIKVVYKILAKFFARFKEMHIPLFPELCKVWEVQIVSTINDHILNFIALTLG